MNVGRLELYIERMLEEADEKPITDKELSSIEYHLDRLFKDSRIDIEFTRHFLDRVNDIRNVRQITAQELIDVFSKMYDKFDHGKKISMLGPDIEAVLTDMSTDVNIPFILRWDSRNRELDLVAKTVMRKKNFRSPDKFFYVN